MKAESGRQSEQADGVRTLSLTSSLRRLIMQRFESFSKKEVHQWTDLVELRSKHFRVGVGFVHTAENGPFEVCRVASEGLVTLQYQSSFCSKYRRSGEAQRRARPVCWTTLLSWILWTPRREEPSKRGRRRAKSEISPAGRKSPAGASWAPTERESQL